MQWYPITHTCTHSPRLYPSLFITHSLDPDSYMGARSVNAKWQIFCLFRFRKYGNSMNRNHALYIYCIWPKTVREILQITAQFLPQRYFLFKEHSDSCLFVHFAIFMRFTQFAMNRNHMNEHQSINNHYNSQIRSIYVELDYTNSYHLDCMHITLGLRGYGTVGR